LTSRRRPRDEKTAKGDYRQNARGLMLLGHD
jgi:hypothetical protein